MNWGKGIAIGIGLFMAFILALAIYMMGQTPELEEKNYYEKDLRYQQEMEAKKNASSLARPAQVTYDSLAKTVVVALQLPEAVKGTIAFSRPSDASQDISLPLMPQDGKQVVPVGHLSAGLWRMQLNWETAGKQYQSETWEINLK